MRIQRSTVVRVVSAALTASLCAYGVQGCTRPTDADTPVVVFPDAAYLFACNAWTPVPPPATRTLLDIRSSQNGTDLEPSVELVRAIERAGGRVVYRYNGPMVRAELNVAAVARLPVVDFAQTAADPDAHDVRMIVLLSHPVTAADVQAVEALGGRVLSQWTVINGYGVVIDDARVRDVRALPGVASTSFDAMYCLQ